MAQQDRTGSTSILHHGIFIGILVGLAGGIFGGLVGLGGGIIMIPLLTTIVKVAQHKAHGTTLVAVVGTGTIGAITYFFHGNADWKAAAVLAVSAIPTVRFGAVMASKMNEKRLRRTFGAVMIIILALLLVKGYLPAAATTGNFLLRIITLAGAGLVTGFISGMMGIGGGAVMIPALVVFVGMEQHLSQGTSLMAMIPIGITGIITHRKLGNIESHLAGGLLCGAMMGGFLGGTIANYLPEFPLKVLFVSIGIWVAVRYLFARK